MEPHVAGPHVAGSMGSGKAVAAGAPNRQGPVATALVLAAGNRPASDATGQVSQPSTSGPHGRLPEQGPQGLQARVQARLRMPLTTSAVQAKTAGRESVALAGDIANRQRSGALARAQQQVPEAVRVTPEPGGTPAAPGLTPGAGPYVALAAPADGPAPPQGVTDQVLRRAVAPTAQERPARERPAPAASSAAARPAGTAPEQPGRVANTGPAGEGGQSSAPGAAAADLAARGPQATGQPVETARQVTPAPAGSLPGAGFLRQQDPMPVVRAVQEVRRSPAGPAAGEADRSSGVESTGAGYRQARQNRVVRRAVEPVTPGELPVRTEVANEVRRETSAVRPPTSTAGLLAGTGGQAGHPRSAPGAMGAVIVERSLSLSHVQRAASADPRPQPGTLVRRAAVTQAAGQAMVQLASLRTLLREDAMPAPDTEIRRTVTPGAAAPGRSEPTAHERPSPVFAVPPAGDSGFPHVTPAMQDSPAERTNPPSLPAAGAASAGAGSNVAPPLLPAGSAPVSEERVMPSAAGGNALVLARSMDPAPRPRPELPVVRPAPGVQEASIAAEAVTVRGQLPDAIGGQRGFGPGLFELHSAAARAVPARGVMRMPVVDAGVAEGVGKARLTGRAAAVAAAAGRETRPHVVPRSGMGVTAEPRAGIGVMRQIQARAAARAVASEGSLILRLPAWPNSAGEDLRRLPSPVPAPPAGTLDVLAPIVRPLSGTQASAVTSDSRRIVTAGGADALRTGAGLRRFNARRSGARTPTPTAPSLPHLQLKTIYTGGEAVVQAAPQGEVYSPAHNTGSQITVHAAERSSGSGPESVLLQRETDGGPDAAPVSQLPAAPATPADQANESAGIDLPRVADQVYELIRRRLIRERESKG
jgi:hypothetical protein